MKKLEALVRKLHELIISMGMLSPSGSPVRDDTDEPMFSKRPLGWSCASCDKGVVNLEGKLAEYTPWNKFPMRNATERIARVG